MPANIDKMFSVREGTWHGLEDALSEYPTLQDVKDYFGFEVVPTDLYYDPDPDDDESDLVQVIGMQALTRNDTGAFLSAVTDSYGIVQPDVLVDLTEAVVAGKSKDYPVLITTGGLLNGGCIQWVLAEVDREWYVDGDTSPIKPYVLLVNSFDRSYALMARTTGVRVVCQNTLDLSVAEGGAGVFRFKHTSNVMDRAEDARNILRGASSAIDSFVNLSNELVKAKVTKAGTDKFLKAFIPEPADLLKNDRSMKTVEEGRAAVKHILSGATGTVTSRHSGTAYGLYTAGVEFLDFNRQARSAESLFTRTMLKQDPAKAELLKMVRLAAKV